MAEELSLSEIFDANELVIVDTSCNSQTHFSFGKYFSSIFNYSQLDERVLDKCIIVYSEMEKMFRHPNTRTIPEVSDETRKLNKSLLYMDRRVRNNGKVSSEKFKLGKKIDLLKKSIKEAHRVARECELNLCDSRYESLVHMVNITNSAFSLKSSRKKWKEDVSAIRRPGSYHGPRVCDTDERLVAATFYSLMYSGKTPVVVSKDSDFIHLFRHGTGIIGSRVFSPYNSEFNECVSNNGFRFYFGFDGKWQLREDNDSVHWWSGHKIEERLGENASQYFSEIKSSWNRFNSFPVLEFVY